MTKIDNIFQIAISDSLIDINKFSTRFRMNMDSFQMNYPDANYHLYSDSDIKDFLFEKFNNDVLDAYLKLKPFAYKADLARYCLLYIYGGVYSDLSYFHINSLEKPEGKNMVAFRDIVRGHPAWAVSNALIFSVKGLNIFQYAIETIVDNVAKKFYGFNPLDITGPYFFGRLLSNNNDYNEYIFGYSGEFSKNISGYGNIFKAMPDDKIIAVRNKLDGEQVSNHGLEGNNYSELWKRLDVYHP